MSTGYAMAICGNVVKPNLIGSWGQCYECALEIFICNSTRNVVKKNYPDLELRTYCIDCGEAKRAQERPPVAPLSEEQISDIERTI